MEIFKITRENLEGNAYKGVDIGKWNAPANITIEIEADLGKVFFGKGIYVKGAIIVKAGSGIEAGWSIKAGEGIEAGSGIKAGWGIEAGEGIEAGWGIISLFSTIKALTIKIDMRCRLIAGCFSFGGAQEIEAQEIVGEIAYGIKKILPKEEQKNER